MASNCVVKISRQDLQDAKSECSASISDVKHLSSYNWIEASKAEPTIAVPGSPPLWRVPKVEKRLKKDSGLVYIAQNAARHPDSPLEPLFRALYITDPSFDIRSIDVASDRNNIRKLLSFVNPSASKNGYDSFTISVEVNKHTALFCREETATHEFIGPTDFRGFGHEFEKAYTIEQIHASTGHHRIISYKFGGLKFIVRHETDGYVGADTVQRSPSHGEAKVDDLSSVLESLTLAQKDDVPPTAAAGSKLRVKEEGSTVPLDATLEIKTRVAHKPLDLRDVAPQLWVSQTPKLVRAYHIKGQFQNPKVDDVTAQIKRWEEDNAKDLKRLATLIKMVIAAARECGGKAVIRYSEGDDKLVIRKREGRMMLPEDLYCKWDDGESTTEETAQDVVVEEDRRSEESQAGADSRE